jgi:hypothetical protein
LFIDSEKKWKWFRKLSRFLADNTILPENWISFYRKEEWLQLYGKLIKAEKSGVKFEEPVENFTPAERELKKIIQKNDCGWIIKEILKTD